MLGTLATTPGALWKWQRSLGCVNDSSRPERSASMHTISPSPDKSLEKSQWSRCYCSFPLAERKAEAQTVKEGEEGGHPTGTRLSGP